MSSLIEEISQKWELDDPPFLLTQQESLSFDDLRRFVNPEIMSAIGPGDVVALIGDFDSISLSALLHLFDRGVIVAPLTRDTEHLHDYFFEILQPDFVIREDSILKLSPGERSNVLSDFVAKGRPGLILFTSGSSGAPKGILHDFGDLIRRYRTPRPTLRTLAFLRFDHIGGINTFFHSLFNKGVVVTSPAHELGEVLELCGSYAVELLPTTPTFIRLMALSGIQPKDLPKSLKLITYGTERMDQATLSFIAGLLPNIDFRQTYGMTELGIMRVKSKARDSLWMKVGGEGIETKVVDSELFIRARDRMVGYLNAASPFDQMGWYPTADLVETDGDWLKIIGRTKDEVNFGGLKFSLGEVEDIASSFEGVRFAKGHVVSNSLTGQHVELTVDPIQQAHFDIDKFKTFLRAKLPKHMVPLRVRMGQVEVSHRYKKL